MPNYWHPPCLLPMTPNLVCVRRTVGKKAAPYNVPQSLLPNQTYLVRHSKTLAAMCAALVRLRLELYGGV